MSYTGKLFIVFLLWMPTAYPLSFNISPITISKTDNFNFSDDAHIDVEGIQVTTNDRFAAVQERVGRVIYKEALHLWDKESGNMADFSTNFSFIIDSNGNDTFADGMTFYLAPLDQTLRNWSIPGGTLGLGYPTNTTNSSSSSFVAVEFDTYYNDFDPRDCIFHEDDDISCRGYPYVGIDINDMESVTAIPWYNDITRGPQNDAWISYNATSKMLDVQFTGINNNVTRKDNLSYEVDLRKYLPEYVSVGFSASTGEWFEKHTIISWNFSSSLKQQPTPTPTPTPIPTPTPTPTPTPSPNPANRGNKKAIIVRLGIVGISLLFLTLTFAFSFLWCKKNKKKKKKKKNNELTGSGKDNHFSDSSMDNEFQTGIGPRRFSYQELESATNNFSELQKLGEGGFGGVYRGFLRTSNTHVAVKRISKGSKQGRKEYKAEVKIISQLRHINLVQLVGWCHQREELLLVYEFMPNKSLDSHLFKLNSVLTWEMRYKIAQGLASALLYLHEGLRQYVVHRDIKASNIMLDADFNVKLGDFGLARLVDQDKHSQTTVPAGTIGYMAPEYPITGRASKETDMYSFGIVLLEIACGRRPIDHRNPQDRVVLVEWVWSLYGGGRLLDAADPKLDSSEDDARKIEHLIVVGLWCVHPDSSQRPPIRQVMQVLNNEAPLPNLPPAMPRAMYDVLEMMNVSSNAYYGSDNPSNLTTPSAGSTWVNTLPR